MTNHFYHNTPIFKSFQLAKEKKKNVHYKMECYQPSGSFKIRGMEELCRFHVSQGKTNFVASSGGNAGYSLAFVGNQLNLNITVVVPKSTSHFMINKMRCLNATVIVHGDVWDEANQHAIQLAEDQEAVYVSPFDDPLLWKGHSSMIDECAKEMKQPDKIIVSVGGGGLLIGILEGLKRNGWQDTEIITTETIGAASFNASFQAQKIVELEKIDSIATSLGAKKIAEQTLILSREFNISPRIVSDSEAIAATKLFLKEYNVLVEPACGAALSIPYFYSDLIKGNELVLVIACGGVNTPS
jgi:L-serine/L-threonine ammonia-lyase